MSIREMAREVDTRLAALYSAKSEANGDMDRIVVEMHYAAGHRKVWNDRGFKWSGTYEEAFEGSSLTLQNKMDAVEVRLYDIQIEIMEAAALYAEFGWNRAFIVENHDGHVHSSMDCSTCFASTKFGWLTDYSGAEEIEIVEDAGSSACTICYPSAPADILNREPRIASEARKAKQAAAAERAIKFAAKVAKAKAAAATASGEPLLVPCDWSNRMEAIKTERTARSEWNSAESSKGWTKNEERLAAQAIRQALIEEALAGKYGVSVEEMKAQLKAKFAKRRRD